MMFETLLEELERSDFSYKGTPTLISLGYRKGVIAVGGVTHYPNSDYIYQNKKGNYIAGSTTPRGEISGEMTFFSKKDVIKDSIQRVKIDKKLFDKAQKEGKIYPPLPY